ncbi:MAG: glycosyl hydrolase-related protein [Candidatus Kryptonium sp.]
MILSSIKIAEDKQGIVVRFYNVGSATEKFKLRTYRGFKIYKADLKEDKIKEIKNKGDKISLTARKGEVLTLYFAI